MAQNWAGAGTNGCTGPGEAQPPPRVPWVRNCRPWPQHMTTGPWGNPGIYLPAQLHAAWHPDITEARLRKSVPDSAGCADLRGPQAPP